MTSSPTNPSAAYPQVNPKESVEADGLNSSDSGQPHNGTTKSFTKTSPSYGATEDPGTVHPVSATDERGLTCGNTESATRHSRQPTRQPLTWPLNPAWAERWQRKIDAARLPQQRADVAWRALCAAVRKAKLDNDQLDAFFDEVADWLIARANGIAPPLPPEPRPARKPVRDLHGRPIGAPYDPEDYA